MNLQEAYQLTIDKVLELQSNGIEVTIIKSNGASRPETVKKYSGPEYLPSDQWVHVTFKPINKEDVTLISTACDYLGMAGITFDTGGCCGSRDWELDWSFNHERGEDVDRKQARAEVEDIINDLDNEEKT